LAGLERETAKKIAREHGCLACTLQLGNFERPIPAGNHDRIEGREDFAGLAGFCNGPRAQELDARDLAAARDLEIGTGKWREAANAAVEFPCRAQPIDAGFGLLDLPCIGDALSSL